MNECLKNELVAFLWQYLTPEKQAKIEQVLSYRTRFITVVLEDIYQSHNANAIIRSADCFGVQDIHVIEDRHRFNTNVGISRGATQWIDLHRYKSTVDAVDQLRKDGYLLVAATPEAPTAIFDVPLTQKLALIFGTEQLGLSEYAKEQADIRMHIPMHGFTQSFNVSVSVSLCLQPLIHALHSAGAFWHLSDEEKSSIKLQWARMVIRASALLEQRFLEEKGER